MKFEFAFFAAGCVAFSSLPLAAQNLPLPPECASREPIKPKAPVFPPELVGKDASGKVVLVISYDYCGHPTDLVVEKSSGQPLLDAAALDAARSWRFTPGLQEGKAVAGKVRVPVDFSVNDAVSPARPNTADIKQMVEQWRRMQVPEVRADAEATVPGFLPDSQPIGVSSVKSAIEMLTVKGTETPSPASDVRTFRLNDGLDLTTWDVFEGGWVFAPAVIRMRVVSDGKKSFLVSSGLCEATDPEACKQFDEFMHNMPRQKTNPPPPPPPPSVLSAG